MFSIARKFRFRHSRGGKQVKLYECCYAGLALTLVVMHPYSELPVIILNTCIFVFKTEELIRYE